MQGSMIYSKLKSLFPNDIENINFTQMSSNFMDDSDALSFLISSNLPHLSIDQIHNMCKKQQKNVMQKILQIKKIDLYNQIASVCPSQKDLRTMPVQQVTQKITQYSNKMMLNEQDISDSQSQEHISQNSSSKVIFMPIDYIDDQEPYNQAGNIFDDFNCNPYLPWNDMGCLHPY